MLKLMLQNNVLRIFLAYRVKNRTKLVHTQMKKKVLGSGEKNREGGVTGTRHIFYFALI